MQTAAEFVPDATSGNATVIDIEAPPHVIWQAIQDLRLDDLRAARLLMGIRSLPAVVFGKGSLRRRFGRTAASPLIEALTSSRFVILYCEPDRILTLAVVSRGIPHGCRGSSLTVLG